LVPSWLTTYNGKDKAYEHTVCLFVDRLRQVPGVDVLTLPYGAGLTLVTGKPESREAFEKTYSMD